MLKIAYTLSMINMMADANSGANGASGVDEV